MMPATLIFILAQLDPATGKVLIEGADFLAGKDAKWWVAAVFIFCGFVTLTALRWLLRHHEKYMTSMETQLTEQRGANKELHERLIGYIMTDHQKSIESHNKISQSLDNLAEAVKEMRQAPRIVAGP